MKKIQQFLKSKMIWSGIIAVVSGTGIYAQTGDKTALLTSAYGLVVVVLRYFTNLPMDAK
jgi:hypothetical protein